MEEYGADNVGVVHSLLQVRLREDEIVAEEQSLLSLVADRGRRLGDVDFIA